MTIFGCLERALRFKFIYAGHRNDASSARPRARPKETTPKTALSPLSVKRSKHDDMSHLARL
jgi:hypothetical protein